MAVRDLIKKWDDALALALSARKPELGDADLATASGPDAMALNVRSGLTGGAFTVAASCGCASLMCTKKTELGC